MRKKIEKISKVGGEKHTVTIVEDIGTGDHLDWFVPLADKFLMACQGHGYDVVVVPLPYEVSRLGQLDKLVSNVATSVQNPASLALAFALGIAGCVQNGRIDYECLKICCKIIDEEIKKIEEKGE